MLAKLTLAVPDNPEVWFDLAGVQALLKKEKESIASLAEALQGSAKRLAQNPKAPNLQSNALVDPRFNAFRQSPDFQRIIATPAVASTK